MNLVFGFLFIFIAGCASAPEDPKGGCTMDWEARGRSDAMGGHSSDHFYLLEKVCKEQGVVPDRAAYDSGYKSGLVNFCTRENGFLLGQQRQPYKAQCPHGPDRLFLEGYTKGRNSLTK